MRAHTKACRHTQTQEKMVIHSHTDTHRDTHTHTQEQLYRDSHSDWATFPTGMGSSLDWKTNITPGALWIRSTLGISHWDGEMESGRMRETRR